MPLRGEKPVCGLLGGKDGATDEAVMFLADGGRASAHDKGEAGNYRGFYLQRTVADFSSRSV